MNPIFLTLLKHQLDPEKARQIIEELKYDINCKYDEKDSIGKRYRRQDAIGTPYCITVDHQTMEDNTVTIRYRDSMKQERIDTNLIADTIKSNISYRKLFQKLIEKM